MAFNFRHQKCLDAVPVISVIDDGSVHVGLDHFVTALGYIVYAFESAEPFLQSAQLHNAWCIITDVRMPEMSRLQLQIPFAPIALTLAPLYQ
jgi:FixJ family two-component response regulator